ncbi:MAG TPA: phosphate acyltransferase PlsX [Streptosporangiaceae bacterium]
MDHTGDPELDPEVGSLGHAGRFHPCIPPVRASRQDTLHHGARLTTGDGPQQAGTTIGARRDRPVVAVDAMGGDNAPAEIVAGVVAAVREHGIQVVLAGRPGQLRPLLAAHHATGEIRVVPAEDSQGMDEGSLASWRRPRSSIAVPCQLVRRGQASAVVSAGSTGAIVTTARLRLRLLPGVLRPALAVMLPSRPTPTILIDAGAIADPKPEMLVQFAQLGVVYSQLSQGVAEPRVGLLTIGSEPGKGNKLTRRAYELLSEDPPHGGMPIGFIGNIEGGDLLTGKVDVAVADGFSGNVALKTLEGAVRFAIVQLRQIATSSPAARAGAMLQRRKLREFAELVDSETYGGAVLLGLAGTVVIAHGASRARGVTSACLLAADLEQRQITEKIKERLGSGRHFLRRPLSQPRDAKDAE